MTKPRSKDITASQSLVDQASREALMGQAGCVVWLTGLSGSGKSTIARALEQRLVALRRPAFILDGDNLRHGLCADLGFSPEDRAENIRRAGQVAALMAQAGLVVITALISPYRAGRADARACAPEGRFVEVFVDAPLEECRRRDPKGLYRKAQAGQLALFTGVDAPYEPPARAELTLDTQARDVEDCAQAVVDYLQRVGLIGKGGDGQV